jgi:hypothetical protein
MRKLFRSRWICVVIALYAVTWIGGWVSHARQLREKTESSWRYAKGQLGGNRNEDVPIPFRIHEDGPHYYVAWCVPILPGLLLAESGSSIGPLMGGGGLKVILYYGFGSKDFLTFWRWAA